MAWFEQHCAESERLFGARWEELHRWLDELAGRQPWGMQHRKFRHHLTGIEQAVQLFGEGARAVARQHIVTDLKGEGWKDGDHFPVDVVDYVKMGLF